MLTIWKLGKRNRRFQVAATLLWIWMISCMQIVNVLNRPLFCSTAKTQSLARANVPYLDERLSTFEHLFSVWSLSTSASQANSRSRCAHAYTRYPVTNARTLYRSIQPFKQQCFLIAFFGLLLSSCNSFSSSWMQRHKVWFSKWKYIKKK